MGEQQGGSMTSKISAATGQELAVVAVEVEEVEETTAVEGRDERGMVSAEWTVGIIAAIAIAGVLLAVVTSGPVKSLLLTVILTIIRTFTKGL
jgi:uncharacterized protein DUF4244